LFREAGKKRIPKIDIRFDLTGLTAGQAVILGRKHIIRYNLQMARSQPEVFITETVPHEVAHVVTNVLFGRIKPHGKEWRSIMAFFGIPEPERCHNFDMQDVHVRGQRRWPYACDCTTHQLSTTRHYRVLRGTQKYLCRNCGKPLRYTGS
jgi:SprT protein